MVKVDFSDSFIKQFKKIKDSTIKESVKKQIRKIASNPEIGKPMKYERFGSREVYIKPYRLVYKYYKEKLTVLFLDIYHKDKQ